jgi:serine/threonine-protein kinase
VVAGTYRVGPLLGTRGTSLVYRVEHIGLGTSYALEVLHPGSAPSQLSWRRFAREVRALSALHNKHVVRVHDADTLPSGARYLVTDLLDGTDLRSLLSREGAVPLELAVEYICQVCSALSDAHRLGIVHRDVKPENMFLARYRSASPVIKLRDFGMALFLSDTETPTILGCGFASPHYLSPEQLRNPNAVDERSDIWAVGLCLFELLTGSSPFLGLNSAQIVRTISQGELPRTLQLGELVPAALATVVRRCLERDPGLRPATAEHVIRELEPFSGRHAGAPRAKLRSSPLRTPRPPSVAPSAPDPQNGLV